MPSAKWTTRPDPKDVSRLRREVSEYVVDRGVEPERVNDVTLAVSEIVSNAVLHAFRDGSHGTITVAATVDEDHIRIRVADDGLGLSPRVDSPGAGLGLVIAGQVADRLEIERPPEGGTAVCLTCAAA